MESFIKDEGFFFYRCSALSRLVSLLFLVIPTIWSGLFFYTKGRFDAMHAMPKTGKQPDRLF